MSRASNKKRSAGRVLRTINAEGRARGKRNQAKLIRALQLLSELGLPFGYCENEPRSLKDRQGRDVDLWGLRPLNFKFSFDAKSSQAGVDKFYSKQESLKEFGQRFPFPKYAILVPHWLSDEDIALAALRIILQEAGKKEAAAQIPDRWNEEKVCGLIGSIQNQQKEER